MTGFPSPAQDYEDEEINLLKLLNPNPPATFYWRVKGQAMKRLGIYEDDILIVDRSLKASAGDVAIVIVDGERLLRRIGVSEGRYRLFKDSEEEEDVSTSEVEVWGVVRCNVHWAGDRKT